MDKGEKSRLQGGFESEICAFWGKIQLFKKGYPGLEKLQRKDLCTNSYKIGGRNKYSYLLTLGL